MAKTFPEVWGYIVPKIYVYLESSKGSQVPKMAETFRVRIYFIDCHCYSSGDSWWPIFWKIDVWSVSNDLPPHQEVCLYNVFLQKQLLFFGTVPSIQFLDMGMYWMYFTLDLKPHLFALPETNSSHLKNKPSQKETIVFQPSILQVLRCYFQGGYLFESHFSRV